MKTSLSRSKRKKGSMTTDTNTVIEIETKLMNELSVLKDPNVGKERKKKARIAVKRYEKFMNDIDYKHINGHKYPERMAGFPDDKPMDKKEVLKLIDSVEVSMPEKTEIPEDWITNVNLQGLMLTLEDKGWDKPKIMKPVNLFK